MKGFTFVAWCSYARGDYSDSYVYVELTNKEAERLIAYGTSPERYDFKDCEELQDIYHKVYEVAVEQMSAEFSDNDYVDDIYKQTHRWRIDEHFPCWVDFPEEFESMITEDEE